jgi:hypothetical protein
MRAAEYEKDIFKKNSRKKLFHSSRLGQCFSAVALHVGLATRLYGFHIFDAAMGN